jgi:hypothetical protein
MSLCSSISRVERESLQEAWQSNQMCSSDYRHHLPTGTTPGNVFKLDWPNATTSCLLAMLFEQRHRRLQWYRALLGQAHRRVSTSVPFRLLTIKTAGSRYHTHLTQAVSRRPCHEKMILARFVAISLSAFDQARLISTHKQPSGRITARHHPTGHA